jgi:hypothetical protein
LEGYRLHAKSSNCQKSFTSRDGPIHGTRLTRRGFNGTGYVTNSGVVIHPRRSRIARSSIEAITRKKHRLFDISKHPRAAEIETLFTKNVINNTLYVATILEIADANSAFWDHPIKIPILSPISAEEHEARWVESNRVIRKGDLIFTLDTKSVVSRVITYFDQGAWSHTAMYVGDGRIIEAIGEGVVERSIEAYHDPRYRLGVYRSYIGRPERIDAAISLMRSTVSMSNLILIGR